MRLKGFAVLALIFSAPCPALACDGIPDGRLGKIVLQRPAGELMAGFGLRDHPILMMKRLHTGADFKSATGTPVTAAAAGKVAKAERTGQYGNYVRIDHGSGLATAYGHLSKITVKVGDCIAPGGAIGLSGCTGLCSEPHLHFEVLRDGQFVDPALVTESTARR